MRREVILNLKMDEKELIVKYLMEEELLEKISEELDKKIVYEDIARKTIFLVSCGHLVLNKQPTSDNLLINAKSGVGKDYVVRSVMKLWEDNKVTVRQRISPKVLTYWHNSKFEPNWTWDGKILYLEDAENKVLNDPVFKVMSSSNGGQATVVINQIATDIKINGKPTVLLTSASAYLEAEMLRRFPIINLTETEKQSRLIKYKIAQELGEYDPDLKKALGVLSPRRVVIPFAVNLADLFPDNIMIRTLFSRFLDYIKFSASLHQYQRQIVKDKKGREYIEATFEDYDIAKECFMATVSNEHLLPLTRPQKDILNFLKKHQEEKFTVKEISIYVTSLNPRNLYINLNVLADADLIEKTTKDVDSYHQSVTAFRCHEILGKKFNLPNSNSNTFLLKTKIGAGDL